MIRVLTALAAAGLVLWATAALAQSAPVSPAEAPSGPVLPMTAHGRLLPVVRPDGGVSYRSQWPGAYFETAFRGTEAFFRIDQGPVQVRVTVDGVSATLVAREPGGYRVGPLPAGDHRLRVDLVSENQAGSVAFGGFHAASGSRALPVGRRSRQIEFIGDSHTVGYGNTAAGRACTAEEVWATTDAWLGIAGRVAARYGADYQVNAISGRGVVRNFDGALIDTLPRAYPLVLFDDQTRYDDPAWRPQVIVVALGTNDFSTALHPGERWATREALLADYEATYATFLTELRRRNPRAFIVAWAIEASEMAAPSARVVETLRAAGDGRVAFVPVTGLTMEGCHYHPGLADDQAIADQLAAVLDATDGPWTR